MIKTVGFKRAFLMPSRRRSRDGSINGSTVPRSFTFQFWFNDRNSGASRDYIITTNHLYRNPVFDRMIPSQPRYAVKPETFRRLFLLPWKNK